MADKINLNKFSDLNYDASKSNSNATPVYGPYDKLIFSDWGQSEIHHEIVLAFDYMNIRQMKPIQQHSFSYLMNNYNTAMIGFSKGKSVSYLASVFSSIMNNKDDEKNYETIGPKAIILSSSLVSCSELEDLSKSLTSFSKTRKVKVVAYSSISNMLLQKTIGTLCNGCDVLIVKPNSLQHLISNTKLFKWSNLRQFVFDNLDLLLNNYDCEMEYFLNLLLKVKETNSKNIQFISASVKWTRDIDDFLNKLCVKWQYIFGSHLEAARYIKIGFSVVQVQNDKKEKVLELLKNNIKCRKCVLITSNPNELEVIYSYMKKDQSIEVLMPGLMKISKVYTLQKWTEPLEKNQLILICSDDMMFDFYVDGADCLIHYDMPVDKQTFSVRFSVLQDPNNLLVKKERSTFIFLGNNSKDMLQLPKVVEIMKLFGNGEVDSIFLKHAKIIDETVEKEKKSNIFCNNMKQFGICPIRSTCLDRHVLKELDKPPEFIPKSGLAIIKILNVYDASHMSAKLVKLNSTNNLNDDEHWSSVEDNSATINLKLNSFYSNNNSKILHENPKPGDIVAVEVESLVKEQTMITQYFRGIVLGLVSQSTMNPKVIVKLIDQGFVENISKWKLYVLPDVMKNLPTNTVDLFLSSVKPSDLDKKWCLQANARVHKQLEMAENCCDTIIVNICMALETTLWVKHFYRKYWDSELKKYEFHLILPDILLDYGYADKNFEHLEKLSELSIAAGIKMPFSPLKKSVQPKDELSLEHFMSFYKLPQPQWAHLDNDVSTEVSLDYMLSPKAFFVRISKYYDRFCNLQDSINDYVVQNQVEKLKHIIKGGICLAKLPETDRYCRVQITEQINNRFVEVFFVDLGAFHEIECKSLLTIHPRLIIQLPFQAIECSLSGIMDDSLPTGNGLEELNDFFMNLTQNQLCLEVVDTILEAKNTSGNHYEVILYDEAIYMNLEFEANYSQYCDYFQMSKLRDLINNKSVKSNKSKEQWVFDEEMIEEDNCSIDLEMQNQLINDFCLNTLGKSLKELEDEIKEIKTIEENSPTKETSSEITLVTKNDHIFKDCSIDKIEPDEQIKNADSAITKKTSSELKKGKLKWNKKRLNMCLTCNTNEESQIVPQCIWYQNKNYIYLKFNILEMDDDFSVKSSIQSLIFNAKFNQISYVFRTMLYSFIIDYNVTLRRNFEGFHIKAEKLYKTDYEWPRLFACEKWHKYVKYDPEHVTLPHNHNFLIRMLSDYKKKATGTGLNTTNHSQSDDDSEDDADSFDSDSCDDTKNLHSTEMFFN